MAYCLFRCFGPRGFPGPEESPVMSRYQSGASTYGAHPPAPGYSLVRVRWLTRSQMVDLFHVEHWRSANGKGMQDMLTEARRVLNNQRQAYPNLIATGRITTRAAGEHMDCMAGIVELLEANQHK